MPIILIQDFSGTRLSCRLQADDDALGWGNLNTSMIEQVKSVLQAENYRRLTPDIVLELWKHPGRLF